MGFFDRFRRKKPAATIQEVVGLQADIAQNYNRFIGQLQSFYRKGEEHQKNKKDQEVEFKKAQLREVDDLIIKVFRINSQKEVLRNVRQIALYFNVFWQKDKSYDYEIDLIPVHDDGQEKWSILYKIHRLGKSQVHPKFFERLDDLDLFQAITKIIYENTEN